MAISHGIELTSCTDITWCTGSNQVSRDGIVELWATEYDAHHLVMLCHTLTFQKGQT